MRALVVVAGIAAGADGVEAQDEVADDFYLRVGIGLDHPAEIRFMDKDCSSVSPAALYGCGPGADGAPLRARGDFGMIAGLELGLGYAGVSTARLEVLIEYRPRFVFEGRANFLEPTRRQSVSADLSSLSGMLAAYMDLPELGLPRLGPFSPFIGGGVGAARTEIAPTASVYDIVHMFLTRSYRKFPVVDESGTVVGQVSRRDTLIALESLKDNPRLYGTDDAPRDTAGVDSAMRTARGRK